MSAVTPRFRSASRGKKRGNEGTGDEFERTVAAMQFCALPLVTSCCSMGHNDAGSDSDGEGLCCEEVSPRAADRDANVIEDALAHGLEI